jgi:hypothetical protein
MMTAREYRIKIRRWTNQSTAKIMWREPKSLNTLVLADDVTGGILDLTSGTIGQRCGLVIVIDPSCSRRRYK